MSKYKRRKYGNDTVIYIAKTGHFLTIVETSEQRDTFELAKIVIDKLNTNEEE